MFRFTVCKKNKSAHKPNFFFVSFLTDEAHLQIPPPPLPSPQHNDDEEELQLIPEEGQGDEHGMPLHIVWDFWDQGGGDDF